MRTVRVEGTIVRVLEDMRLRAGDEVLVVQGVLIGVHQPAPTPEPRRTVVDYGRASDGMRPVMEDVHLALVGEQLTQRQLCDRLRWSGAEVSLALSNLRSQGHVRVVEGTGRSRMHVYEAVVGDTDGPRG